MRMARSRAGLSHRPPLEQYLLSGSRQPFSKRLLSLASSDGELAETVKGNVLSEKILQHRGKQVGASVCELRFIELHFDSGTTGEVDAVIGNNPCKVALTGNRKN